MIAREYPLNQERYLHVDENEIGNGIFGEQAASQNNLKSKPEIRLENECFQEELSEYYLYLLSGQQ